MVYMALLSHQSYKNFRVNKHSSGMWERHKKPTVNKDFDISPF